MARKRDYADLSALKYAQFVHAEGMERKETSLSTKSYHPMIDHLLFFDILAIVVGVALIVADRAARKA